MQTQTLPTLQEDLAESLRAEQEFRDQIDTQRALAAEAEHWQTRERHFIAVVQLRMQLRGQEKVTARIRVAIKQGEQA